MEQTKFIKMILNIMSPISEISTNANDKYIGLYKSSVMFGKILENKVFLLNYTNKFAEVENSLITSLLKPELERDKADLDMFLLEVTKAWWFALGKKINILNMNEILKNI